MLVEDQKGLALRLPHEPAQKLPKDLVREPLPEDHEHQAPPVRDGRDHVAAESLARPRDDRRLSLSAVGRAAEVVGPKPHLVAPIDFGLLPLGFGADSRINFAEPPANFLGILLERPAHRLLRRESPSPQHPSDRPDGQLHPVPPLDQFSDGLPRPEPERQLQLIRATIHDRPRRLRRLPRKESAGPSRTPARVAPSAPAPRRSRTVPSNCPTAWRVTPNIRAASTSVIPLSTASTAFRRNCSWPAGGSDLKSWVFMPAI